MFKKMLVTMANLNFFHWLTLALTIVSLFNFVYVNTMKPLLLKVGVRSKYIIPIIETIWQFSFLIIGLPMTFVCLEEHNLLSDWVLKLDKELTACKLHEETTVQGMKSVFILITAFSLNDIITTWMEKGFKNLVFYEKQVFFAIFALTCYSKCGKFGLSLYFMSNWATIIALGSKMSYFAAQYTKSNSVRMVAKVLCAVSITFWIYTHLYIYPVFLSNNKSVNSAMMKAELNMLIVMDFLTWIYLAVATTNSMFFRITLSYAVPSQERPHTLAYFLFGCDPWILWLTKSQKSTIHNDSEVFENPGQRHLRTLRATIRCRNIIMRRVSRMREERRSTLSGRREE